MRNFTEREAINKRKELREFLNRGIFLMLISVLISAILTSIFKSHTYSSFADVCYVPEAKYEYWEVLSEKEKVRYDCMINFFRDEEETKKCGVAYFFSNLDRDAIDNESWIMTQDSCYLDHPEYELRGIDIWNGPGYMKCKYNKTDKSEYLKMLEEVDSEITELVSQVNQEYDIILKYKLIYDWMTTNVKYDDAHYEYIKSNGIYGEYSEESTNIYGAIVKKKAVCDGISDAFKYICNKCNLECISTLGYVENVENAHKWNIVPIKNMYFLIDCTFGLIEEDDKEFQIKDKMKYFLNENIELNERIYKYKIPRSENEFNTDIKQLHITKAINNYGETVEGINFTCNNNYKLNAKTEEFEYSEIFGDDNNIIINSNGTIYKVLLVDSDGKIIVIEDCDDSVTIEDYYNDIYIAEAILYVEYRGNSYNIRFKKSRELKFLHVSE